MSYGALVKSYNDPAFAQVVPASRGRRQRGRTYRVPYVEAVVPVDGPLEQVQRCVDALLEAELDDLRILLVADWSVLGEERVSPLGDPLRDLGILQRGYRDEPRVELVQPDADVLTGRCRSPFRMTLATTALVPIEVGVGPLVADLERTHFGLSVVHDGDGAEVVRVARTAARSRARWHAITDEAEVDAFVAQTFGRRDSTTQEAGWVPWDERTIRRYRRPKFGAAPPEESWARVQETVAPAIEPYRRRAARLGRPRS